MLSDSWDRGLFTSEDRYAQESRCIGLPDRSNAEVAEAQKLVSPFIPRVLAVKE